MTDALITATDKVEGVFDAMGLMQGTFAPVGRGAVGFAFGTWAAEAIRPEVSYNPNGTRRPWVLTTPDAENPTYIPWWTWGALTGLFCSTLI